ncbi:MAG: GNAT family N-acetyltransferase [Lachnospiraceae bacterium]|nr:GNAT family N-acetyltransferase [Lachnospiraceae bacterium]
MDIIEQYENIVDSKETHDLFYDLDLSPVYAMYAEPVMEKLLADAHKEMDAYPRNFKNEPYQMYRRYLALFKMHYDLLANVHPLTSIGKERIENWRKTVDEYEALSDSKYPLIATVTKNTAHLVKHLIPREYLELIENPKRHVLCAMSYKPTDEEVKSYVDFVLKENEGTVDFESFSPTEKRGGVVPAGVLSFVEDDGKDGKTIRLEWLYVAPERRNMGLCNALYYEMLYILRDTDFEAIVATMDQRLLSGDGEKHEPVEPTTALLRAAGIAPEDREFDPKNEYAPLVHFITNMKFQAEPITERELVFTTSNIRMTSEVLKEAKKHDLHSLWELDDLTFRKLTSKILFNRTGVYDNQIPFVGRKRYDADISVFYEENAEIKGILLARQDYRGRILVEMEFGDKPEEAICRKLFTRFMIEVLKKYEGKPQLVVPISEEVLLNVSEQLLINPKYNVAAGIALIRPENDISSEEWNEAVQALQNLSAEELEKLSNALTDVTLEERG